MTHIYGSSSSNFSKISQFSLKNHTKNFPNLRQIEVNNRQIYWSIWWHLMCFINILTFREFYELNVTWPHVRCIELRLLRHFKTTNSLFIKSYFLTDKIEFWWIIRFWSITAGDRKSTHENIRFSSLSTSRGSLLSQKIQFSLWFLLVILLWN